MIGRLHPSNTANARRRWPGWLLLVGLLWPALATADNHPQFRVKEAATRLVNEVYHLDARLQMEFSSAVLEALGSGVPLTVEFQIEILKRRSLLWDSRVAKLSQRYELAYHALSDQYLLTNLNTLQRRSFPSQRAAFANLGMVHDFPMLDRRLLQVGATYTARLRARLDVEALPLPLRPMAYLSQAWDLTSDWHTWLLDP